MGDAISINDKPSVGGSKETKIKMTTAACFRFARKNLTVVKPTLIRKVITIGNSKISPKRDDVNIISDTKRLISQ